MQLLLPEILSEVRDLSLPVTTAGLLIGLFLWLMGWWSHRFWMVLVATVSAGLFGLHEAGTMNMQPLLGAFLLAIAAGTMGLSIMRLVIFAFGGLGLIVLMKVLVPTAQAPMVFFLAGGVITTIVFRLWVMLLTSFAGTMLMVYCCLGLIDGLAEVDLVQWCQEHSVEMNWGCLVLTVLGYFNQFFWDGWRKKRNAKKAAPKEEKPKDEAPAAKEPPKEEKPAEPKKTRWGWLRIPFRKAA